MAASCLFCSDSESFGGAADGCDCFLISPRSNRNRLSARRGGYRTEENFILSVVGGDCYGGTCAVRAACIAVTLLENKVALLLASPNLGNDVSARGREKSAMSFSRLEPETSNALEMRRHVVEGMPLVCGGELTLQVVI